MSQATPLPPHWPANETVPAIFVDIYNEAIKLGGYLDLNAIDTISTTLNIDSELVFTAIKLYGEFYMFTPEGDELRGKEADRQFVTLFQNATKEEMKSWRCGYRLTE